MKYLSDYDYFLPAERIAQNPRPRGESKLFVYDRQKGSITFDIFRHIKDYLGKDYIMVLNETKVYKARVFVKKETGGQANILITKKAGQKSFYGLLRKKTAPGTKFLLPDNTIIEVKPPTSFTLMYRNLKTRNERLPRAKALAMTSLKVAPTSGQGSRRLQPAPNLKVSLNACQGQATTENQFVPSRTPAGLVVARPWRANLSSRTGLNPVLPAGGEERDEGVSSNEYLFEAEMNVDQIIEKFGSTPLPPYIKKKIFDQDKEIERYNTVYSRSPGSIAAPTAGLHFTEQILSELSETGVEIRKLILHIGPSSFVPIREENTEKIRLGEEFYEIPPETASLLKEKKRKVIPVGTSTVRALESWALTEKTSGRTGLFIKEGFEFKMTDAVVTNFHLPKSTHFIMIASFLKSIDRLKELYARALEKDFYFYSYGDSMLII